MNLSLAHIPLMERKEECTIHLASIQTIHTCHWKARLTIYTKEQENLHLFHLHVKTVQRQEPSVTGLYQKLFQNVDILTRFYI